MCGILGVVERFPRTVDMGEVRRALTTIRHRGPDDEGYVLVNSRADTAQACRGSDSVAELELPAVEAFDGQAWDVVLAHRRLSIIDLSVGGHQPMPSPDGDYWITFNGEIYNYIELRGLLEKHGHVFVTRSDTEVLLAAYRQWGPEMLPQLIGMFALAILDVRAKRLFLARDPFGIKPLYYTATSDTFAFASEIKALLQLRAVGHQANPQRLYTFLRFANTDYGADTMFANVHQLAAAHHVTLDITNLAVSAQICYWRPARSRPVAVSYGDAVNELRALFAESMALHMRSDVPVGSCLSGGIDSSAIVAFMRKVGGPGQRLHTFSYIASDPVFNEEAFVDLMNARYGGTGHKVALSGSDFAEEIQGLIRAQEQPFMSTSVFAQYRVFRMAHEAGVKVMLDGQGADELFAGYLSLLGARISELLSAGKMEAAWRTAKGVPRNMRTYRVRMLLAALGRLLPAGVSAAAMHVAGQRLWPSFLNREWFSRQGVEGRRRLAGHGTAALQEELRHSVEALSLPQLLRFEDLNSMSVSVESRVPFCYPKLAAFAQGLPSEYLVAADGTTKAVLRSALQGTLPDAILTREKVGFSTPENEWLGALHPLIAQVLKAGDVEATPFLNAAATRTLLSAPVRGGGPVATYLWRCVNVLQWARAYDVTWN